MAGDQPDEVRAPAGGRIVLAVVDFDPGRRGRIAIPAAHTGLEANAVTGSHQRSQLGAHERLAELGKVVDEDEDAQRHDGAP
jgi:hypothetical protein